MNCIKSVRKSKESMQDVLQEYPALFNGVGKMKDYQVELLTDISAKPVAEPPRRIQYHLVDRFPGALTEMLENCVAEEHPVGEHAPWNLMWSWPLRMMVVCG